jgi:hypothetical protein
VTEDLENSARQHTVEDIPSAAEQQPADSGTSAPQSAAGDGSALQKRAAAIANERPEVAVGAAFAGGFLLALILKRIAR